MFCLLLGWVSVGLDAEFGMHRLILIAFSTARLKMWLSIFSVSISFSVDTYRCMATRLT